LFFQCVESLLSKAIEKIKTEMSEANERLFLSGGPPGIAGGAPSTRDDDGNPIVHFSTSCRQSV